MARAMKPLLRLAKHIFSPEAAPMVALMCLMFRISARWLPLAFASSRRWGPELGMLGRDHVLSSFWEGGPPIMPPSMNLMLGLDFEMRLSIVRADLGLTALRSRK